MPAIAPIEDLKSAQKDLLEAKDLNELKTVSEMAQNRLVGRIFVNCGWRKEPQNN
jgi:hypothetical protein